MLFKTLSLCYYTHMKKGSIDISQLNTKPEPHEYQTAEFFSELGKDIVFIKPSDIKDTHTPDFMMDGVAWEVKSPMGNSKHTIENNFRNAVIQSRYIIFDLRRTKLTDSQCLSQLRREFSARPYLKRLLIITHEGTLIEL